MQRHWQASRTNAVRAISSAAGAGAGRGVGTNMAAVSMPGMAMSNTVHIMLSSGGSYARVSARQTRRCGLPAPGTVCCHLVRLCAWSVSARVPARFSCV